MKTLPALLAAHYTQRSTTVSYGLRVIRRNRETGAALQTLGFTSHDRNVVVGGVTYLASPGIRCTSIVSTSGTAVGNLEVTTLNDESLFTRVGILNGIWRNAEFLLFRFNWTSPTDGIEELTAGNLGEIQIRGSELRFELRDWRQYLQQPVGSNSTKTCRYRFGDAKCTKNITAPPLRVTGTVTSVSSQNVFTDSARAEVADFFGEGELGWTSGNNLDAWVKVKEFSSSTFTLVNSMWGQVQIGDTYIAIAGCRKRYEEDCGTKHSNTVNFGGEPHRRGVNSLTAAPGETQT